MLNKCSPQLAVHLGAAVWNHGDYVNILTKGHVWLLLLPLKCVGFTGCELWRVCLRCSEWIWCNFDKRTGVWLNLLLFSTRGKEEIFNRSEEPLSWLQGFWSVDEEQVVSVFDIKDEMWGRIRCNGGLPQPCTHWDLLLSKIHAVQTLVLTHALWLITMYSWANHISHDFFPLKAVPIVTHRPRTLWKEKTFLVLAGNEAWS